MVVGPEDKRGEAEETAEAEVVSVPERKVESEAGEVEAGREAVGGEVKEVLFVSGKELLEPDNVRKMLEEHLDEYPRQRDKICSRFEGRCLEVFKTDFVKKIIDFVSRDLEDYEGDEVTDAMYISLLLRVEIRGLCEVEAVKVESLYDGLLKDSYVLSRWALDESMSREFAEAEREGHDIAVLFIDVDDFKKVNDRYGHHVGDKVLQRLAKVMKETVRGSDIVGRYGGDELVILLPRQGSEEAVVLAQRILLRISEESINGADVTVSIGIASKSEVQTDGEQAEDVRRTSDERMYVIKKLREGKEGYRGGIAVAGRAILRQGDQWVTRKAA